VVRGQSFSLGSSRTTDYGLLTSYGDLSLAEKDVLPENGKNVFPTLLEAAMSQAVVDPLELRRFAHHLKQFNGDLRERLSGLHAEMTRLGDTWRDQEHLKFTEEFEQTLHVIAHFLEVADLHVPFLNRKAERIEEYLQQH
jgi:uncharacterized protein YukE